MSKYIDRIWNTKPWSQLCTGALDMARAVCFGNFLQARIKDLRALPYRSEIGQYDKHIPEVRPVSLFMFY